MKKIIKKLNVYVLYTILFVALCSIIFLGFIKSITNYTIITAIGMYFSGIAFIVYSKYNKKGKFATIIGSLIYVFSGYFLYECLKTPISTLPTILLPLMFLGVDRILKKNKYIIFILTSAVSAVFLAFDSYFLYAITIFTFLYAIIKYFNEYKDRGKKKFLVTFLKLILCYALGVLLVSIIVIHGFNKPLINPNFGFTYYDLDYYIKTFFMSAKTAYWAKAYMLPIILTVLPISVINFKKNRENRTWLITLSVLAIIFAIPFLSYMMNGFVFRTIRWSFVFNFVLAYIVTINVRDDLTYSPREFKFSKKCLILYLVLWFIFRSRIGMFSLTSIILAFIYLITLVARSLDYAELKKNQQFEYAENLKGPKSSIIKFRVKVVLLLILILNVLFFSWQLYSRLKYASDYVNIESTQIPSNSISSEIGFEFDGKYRDKIIVGNDLKIAKKRKSFELKFNQYVSEDYDIYLVIENLKYLSNDQYSITVKYGENKQKQVVRDTVKTPDDIKLDYILFNLGSFKEDYGNIKITFSNTGNYTFDNIKLLAIKNN